MTVERNCIIIIQKLLVKNKIKIHSENTFLGAVFAERFNRTIRDLLKRLVFEKGDDSWIHVLPTITKQYNSRVYASTKLTPIQASSKNEVFVYKNLLDERMKVKPNFQVNDLVRTADLKETFSNV